MHALLCVVALLQTSVADAADVAAAAAAGAKRVTLYNNGESSNGVDMILDATHFADMAQLYGNAGVTRKSVDFHFAFPSLTVCCTQTRARGRTLAHDRHDAQESHAQEESHEARRSGSRSDLYGRRRACYVGARIVVV